MYIDRFELSDVIFDDLNSKFEDCITEICINEDEQGYILHILSLKRLIKNVNEYMSEAYGLESSAAADNKIDTYGKYILSMDKAIDIFTLLRIKRMY